MFWDTQWLVLCVAILLLGCPNWTTGEYKDGKFKMPPFASLNYGYTGSVRELTYTKSVVKCSRECSSRTWCRAINYEKVPGGGYGQCQMFQHVAQDHNDLTERPRFRYLELDGFPRIPPTVTPCTTFLPSVDAAFWDSNGYHLIDGKVTYRYASTSTFTIGTVTAPFLLETYLPNIDYDPHDVFYFTNSSNEYLVSIKADDVDFLLKLPSGSPSYQYMHRVKLQDRFGDQMTNSPAASLSDHTNHSRVYSFSSDDVYMSTHTHYDTNNDVWACVNQDKYFVNDTRPDNIWRGLPKSITAVTRTSVPGEYIFFCKGEIYFYKQGMLAPTYMGDVCSELAP